ncbi:MAG: tetratricopeptide repeat protein [Candidatus Symbiothrix sp.]|jgi:hypothetical protein|nr:tetratricopeptide repeat protein [Candidatus Symbiothrix sp.]
MQAGEIIGLMQGKIPYTRETLSDLSALLAEYPYFQTAQVLNTLNLKAEKDSRFNAALRKTACYVGDRRKLFYWIEKEAFPPEMIAKLEKEEETFYSSFELVDFFLSGKQETSKENNRPIEQPVVDIAPAATTDYLTSLMQEAPAQTQEPVSFKDQSTIDKFLEEDKHSPIKINLTKEPEALVEETPPEEESVSKSGFLTETLAKIYIKQKKYDKALEIIHKLNLIYPEKNIYFADQIRFLEKLIINTNNIK